MSINLRSDTQTMPTEEMLDVMRNAQLGDDVFGEDPTVNRLEKLSADRLGKEAALFVSSGTMGNLCALMSHTQPGDEVILEKESHIYYYEVGGFSRIAGLSPRLVPSINGIMNLENIKSVLRPADIHFPAPSLLCLENSHNRGGGTIYSVEQMDEISNFAHDLNFKVHVDGARIFNAAVALGVDVKRLVKEIDSVMFCLSKGLSAPVGSVLVGSKLFITKARKARKLLGGGMRQAGVLAAAGIIALEKMVDRLKEDHLNARYIAEELKNTAGLDVDLDSVQTNMVYCNTGQLKVSPEEFVVQLNQEGVQVLPMPPNKIRIVVNRHISQEDAIEAVRIIKKITAKNI
ncbi:MAG: GntG family PLP-dependent aldolase [Atribacterota bacterium]|nr:GntG family PLP-dependent aldolase [Atribacterota bacterium]